MTWKDITLGQYNQIVEFQKDPDNFMVNVVSLLYDCNADEIPLQDFIAKCNSLSFMKEEIKPNKANKTYNIGGRKYKFNYDMTDITTAQYFDFTSYVKQPNNTTNILSLVLIPEGHTYNDGYDMAQTKEDIEQMSICDVTAMYAFFLNSFKRFITLLLRYLRRAVKKTKMEMEKKEQAMKLIQTLMEYSHY